MSEAVANPQPELSVVIPAKDEADNIAPLVDEIYQALEGRCDYEILYVDDGSRDGTFEVIKALKADGRTRLRALRHAASVGQSTAIMSGVGAAQGRWIVTLDADGQNDPADIPALLEAAAALAEQPHFCIAGYRKKRRDTAWKRFQSRLANGVRRRLLNDGTPDTGCGLKVLPRATLLAMPYFDHMHRYLPALTQRLGGAVQVVEVNHRERERGVSKYTMWNRLWVGLVDLAGVMWLQRRAKRPGISDRC